MSERDPVPGSDEDPNLIRNQPALTTARRRGWFLWAGLLALASVVVLALLYPLQPLPSVLGMSVIVALYAAMLATGAVSSARTRNLVFAGLLIAMAVVALICVLAVMAAEWTR